MSANGAGGFDYPMDGARSLFGVDSSQAHNDDAYDQLFVDHYDRIVSLLSRLLGNRARAEEVASDVFWRAYQGSMRWEDGKVGGWLYRTATHLGIEELRSRARRQRYEEAAGHQARGIAASGTPLDDLLRAEENARVWSVLATLKKWQARILVLRSSGLSYAELAQVIRVKQSSVGTMLARAEAQFQKQYARMYGAEE